MMKQFLLSAITVLLITVTGCIGIQKKQDTATEISRIEGEITEISQLPNPQKSDYPDCRCTAKFKVNTIQSGAIVPRDLILVVPGFKDRKLEAQYQWQTGDKISVSVSPYDSLPVALKGTQVADEIMDFDQEYFWVYEGKKLKEFSQNGSTRFKVKVEREEEIEPLPPVNASTAAARRQAIADDLKRVNALLAAHNNDTDKWAQELTPIYKAIPRENGACEWIGDSFCAPVPIPPDRKPYLKKRYRTFIEQMTELNEFFRAHNIDLILLKMPEKYEVWADHYLGNQYPEDGILQPHELEIEQQLLNNDIEILTFTDEIRAERQNYPAMFFYNLKGERHPCEGVSRIMAKKIARRLQRYHFPKDKEEYQLIQDSGALRPLKFPAGNAKFPPEQPPAFACVADKQGKRLEIVENGSSPIVIVHASMGVYPNIRKSASLSHYLAYELGTKPDIVYRDGSISPITLFFQKPKEYLSKRRVFIYLLPNFGKHPIIPYYKKALITEKEFHNLKTLCCYDVKNFSDKMMTNCAEMKKDGEYAKLTFAKPMHIICHLGKFTGEKFLLRIKFGHMKNNRCFLGFSSWPFGESAEVTSNSEEKTFDIFLETDYGPRDINVTLSGTQWIKSMELKLIK